MVNAQEWLDNNYPKEEREGITNLSLDSKNLESGLDLSDFTGAQEINLNFNQISSLNINGLSKLKKLHFHGNKISNLDLSSCPEISYLNCNSNFFTSLDFLIALPKPENLRMLLINNNNISSDLTPFKRFVNLDYLDLGNHGSYDEGKRIGEKFYNDFHGSLEPLKDLNKLRELWIYGTDINSGLEYLPESVEKFGYSWGPERKNGKVKISIEKVLNKYFEGSLQKFREFIKNPPNSSAQKWLNENYPEEKRAEIENLDISYSEGKEQLKEILVFKGFTNLKSLNCSGHQLTYLFLSGCPNLTELKCNNNAFEELSFLNPLTKLEILWIQNNKELLKNFSDKSLSFFTSFKELEELDIRNCPFEGSLTPLEDLIKLKWLDISNTNISEGLEDLPLNCEKIYCELDYNSKTMEIIKELGKSVKEKDTGYNLNKWRENNANNSAVSVIPFERLFVIRSNIKKYVDKWSKEEDYEWYESSHWKKQVKKEIALNRLQNPDDFSKSWWAITGTQWVNRAVLVAGGSLVLVGQSDTENPNSQLYTQIGGVIAIAGPFVETVASYINDQIYDAKQKRWDEFVSDTENMLDNYHELVGILDQIEEEEVGKVNEALNDLREKVEAFLSKYDKDGNKTIDISELIEKRNELATDLNEKDNEHSSQLGNILKAIKDLEEAINDYKQDKKNKDNNKNKKVNNQNQSEENHHAINLDEHFEEQHAKVEIPPK